MVYVFFKIDALGLIKYVKVVVLQKNSRKLFSFDDSLVQGLTSIHGLRPDISSTFRID